MSQPSEPPSTSPSIPHQEQEPASTDKVEPNPSTPPKTPTRQHAFQPNTPRPPRTPYRPRFTLVDRSPNGRYVARSPPSEDDPSTVWGVVITILSFKEQFALWDEIKLDNRLLQADDVQAGLYTWRMDKKEEDLEMKLGDWLCELLQELSRWLEGEGHGRFRNIMSQFWMCVEDDVTGEIVREGSPDPQLYRPLRGWFTNLSNQHYPAGQSPNPVPLHLKITWVTPAPFCLVGLKDHTSDVARSLDVSQKGKITQAEANRCSLAGVLLPDDRIILLVDLGLRSKVTRKSWDATSRLTDYKWDLRSVSSPVPTSADEDVIRAFIPEPVPYSFDRVHGDASGGAPPYMFTRPYAESYKLGDEDHYHEQKPDKQKDLCILERLTRQLLAEPPKERIEMRYVSPSRDPEYFVDEADPVSPSPNPEAPDSEKPEESGTDHVYLENAPPSASISQTHGRLPLNPDPLAARSPSTPCKADSFSPPASPTTPTRRRFFHRKASGAGIGDSPSSPHGPSPLSDPHLKSQKGGMQITKRMPPPPPPTFSPPQSLLEPSGDTLLSGGSAPESPTLLRAPPSMILSPSPLPKLAMDGTRQATPSKALPKTPSKITAGDSFGLPPYAYNVVIKPVIKSVELAKNSKSTKNTNQSAEGTSKSAEDIIKSAEDTIESTKDTTLQAPGKKTSRLLHKVSSYLFPKKNWYGGHKEKKPQEKTGEEMERQKKIGDKTGAETLQVQHEAQVEYDATTCEPQGQVEIDRVVAPEGNGQGREAPRIYVRDDGRTETSSQSEGNGVDGGAVEKNSWRLETTG
ncbi:hypothetical protein L202_02207 [Cryptococcus amylolentus CBS 6039]|uniref:Uncharacterized protein n=1 Tax=Cryptococcus amylolentus CBS 6039 TaxID=1295533 RepID=A0A1E3HZX2_9TREE|nr:hypothetical protein L202_02207 [Cryptococcus amylolentus CBS 6039]ODN81847.1 hypothetical protein L202_02207 [Cryptococcus amylolentus CBS 6039]